MNGTDLLLALGDVEEKYVEEAESDLKVVRKWPKFLAIAACMALLLFGLYQSPEEIMTETAGGVIPAVPECIPAEGTAPPQCVQGCDGESLGLQTIRLRVEEWTEDGFTALVLPGATLEEGTVVTVVLPENLAKPQPGTVILVDYSEYNTETKTLPAVSLREEKG